ncbi:MAG: 4-alpha-glucanotransferase [Clostridia bacterium]|nr:4-alpha-glucanotransferase [Clostridia bacterium]
MRRASGVLMHVSSLWGEYSEGSFGDSARKWIDFLADCGFSYWQTLPFCLPDDYNSPYCSLSTFSVNPYFIDLPALVREGLLTEAEIGQARQITPYACEFSRLSRERLALLGKAAKRFDRDGEMNRFFEAHPHTADFCRFMGLRAANGSRPWTEWTVQTPDAEAETLWRFTQYIFFRQWKEIKNYANEKGISVIGDIPIYVALNSSDVWAAPEQFLLDKEHRPTGVAGVPPDYFAEDGQLWGNPLYNWKRMKADGYGWWKDRIRFMCELFDGVRIDHFRGLESYYSIPAGETTARNGTWVKGPGISLIRALKEAAGDRLLIAEDLGDITPAVHKLVKDSGFPSMRVFQFAFLGDENSPHLPHNYDHHCVAYTGTHDNNTLLGYIWELDDATRRRVLAYCGYYGEDWNRGYDSILRTLFQSHAGLLILPVQDLLLYGSDTRLNRPGTSDDNWSYRITEEQLASVDREKFRIWNRLYGRCPR